MLFLDMLIVYLFSDVMNVKGGKRFRGKEKYYAGTSTSSLYPLA